MKISVIIPTFNRAKQVTQAIESVLAQSYSVDEIIVIDDGSTDTTKELLRTYPIVYFFQENKGVSSARNKGIKEAKNDWIAFLDSDDIWHENKIEKQVAYHQQNSHIFFSHTDERWVFNGKEIQQKTHQKKQNKSSFLDHISNTFIGCSTVIIHKSILENIGTFDGELKACEDYDLWLRILTKYQLGYIDEKLIIKLAGHENQLSFETPMQDTYRVSALLKHLDSPYHDEVKKEIFKRCERLIKGGKKHHNHEIVQFYSNLILKLK